MGAILATLLGAATLSRTAPARSVSQSSAAVPLLSYKLDRLFRAARRAPNVDLSAERAEAGRILLTTSSHTGISSDDRAYLIQQVGALTGLGWCAIARLDGAVECVRSSRENATVRASLYTMPTPLECAGGVVFG